MVRLGSSVGLESRVRILFQARNFSLKLTLVVALYLYFTIYKFISFETNMIKHIERLPDLQELQDYIRFQIETFLLTIFNDAQINILQHVHNIPAQAPRSLWAVYVINYKD